MGKQEFIDEKSCGMAEIKYQRVSKRFGSFVVRLVMADDFEQRFVEIKRLVKVSFEFLAFGLAATRIKSQCLADSLLNIH